MSQSTHLRKYGVQTTIDFELYEVDGIDLRTDWVPAAADCEVMKDEGASTQCTNTATDEGATYSIVLTATEMQAARVVLKIVDAATKVFLDKVIIIETYGNASAQHAMDFDDSVRGGMTALPNAAADAAGGLPISDAGGLDLDAVKEGIIAGESSVFDATANTTSFVTLLSEDSDDHYNNMVMYFTSGNLTGQSRVITDYDGTSKTVTFSEAWTEAPADTDAFIIKTEYVHSISQIQTGLATPTNITAGTITTVSGNVDGSVGSVTGAVGSVSGSVGSVVGHTAQTADHTAAIAAIPTTAMRGTDSAALATDLATISGTGGVLLGSEQDVYHADIEYNYDSPVDEYTVRWFKNGNRVTSGITVPTTTVVKRSDGTNLVTTQAMTQIGTTGAYKYDESTNVIDADEIYEVVMVATIDSGSRTWSCHAARPS